MTHHLTLADLASALSLGVAGTAVWSGLFLLVVDAEVTDFDPRPAVRRALDSPVADRLLIAVGPALYDVRRAVRAAAHEAVVSAAFFLLLLTAPAGGTR
ncbi:hypothetical protein ABZX40_13195 [Streptomyces sp. NPDC004610]|uniref:hypothetical protein n=1 Tax=unclassified Streptomyces TaxID=2593676 RepID=UPI0033BDF57E